MIDASFPQSLEPLFQPKRYKVLWGGRGAGRSWGIARALLLIGSQKPIRVLCAREFQNSITESVHKLLSDQIDSMGLGGFYTIQKQGIYGANGTSFSFEGIKNNTTRIKSYEGVDYCWVEEAVKVSKASWGVLIPTIRKNGSEIWMSFNPELENDYTYRRFVKESSAEDTVVIHMTYRDNPWFPETLRKEMEADRQRDYDFYLNVWEGQCLQVLEGAVYATQMRAAQAEGRICTVPRDVGTAVHTAWDLGRADKTAIWFYQVVAMQTRIIDYYENNFEDILHYVKELQARPYTYGDFWLPHDAFAKRLGMKLTIQEQVAEHFPNSAVKKVPQLSLTDGINAARLVFPSCWFDEDNCEVGLGNLRRYRYKITGYSSDNKPIYSDTPIHDETSHGADAWRYLAIALKQPRRKGGVLSRLQDAQRAAVREFTSRPDGPSAGLGWMR